MTEEVSLERFQAARKLLDGVVRQTPVESSRWLSELVGSQVWLKCENLQRTGSFKTRGAYVRIAGLSPDERAAGVVAASAGNHAQGVALAAQLLGIHATVFMPEGAPIPKERATRAYGAEVVFGGTTVEDCLAAAQEHSARTGAVLIHPFDHIDIVSGQGTVGLELLEQLPDVRTVVVPTGGGGLVAGIAGAIKLQRSDVRVVGVQAEGAAAYPASLDAGRPIGLAAMKTMADGIAVGRPGEVPFAAISRYVDEIRTVSEDAISRALLATLERAKLVVEPAGAVGVAALLEAPRGAFEGPVAVVLSGGNVDPLLLGKVIRHGMAAAGRYLVITITISDAPGSLARLLMTIGETGANVIEVVHARNNPALHLDEVEVILRLETRGEAHTTRVIGRLRERGYSTNIS